jgi:signal transduction histidine kinase
MVAAPLPRSRRERILAWVGDGVAALVIAAAAFAPFPVGNPDDPFSRAIAILPALLLPARRRWPIAVLASCIALYGISAVAGVLSPGIVIATAIAAFGVANRTDRRTAVIVSLLAILTIVGLSLLATLSSETDPRVVQFAVTIAFAAAAGDATRSRREYIVAITERAERAEQTRDAEARRRVSEERLRIARDLHDVVAHQISVISLNAGVASSSLRSKPERAEEALGTIRGAARTVLGEIGDLLTMLRADGEHETAAPQPGLGALDALLAEFTGAGLDVTLRTEGDVARLSRAVDVVAYRVIQEALTNAHKHGGGGRAHVLVSVGDDSAEIVVTNPVATRPATGSAAGTADAHGGHGLLGLRERVAAVRGSVETGATPAGFRLAAVLPVSGSSPESAADAGSVHSWTGHHREPKENRS